MRNLLYYTRIPSNLTNYFRNAIDVEPIVVRSTRVGVYQRIDALIDTSLTL